MEIDGKFDKLNPWEYVIEYEEKYPFDPYVGTSTNNKNDNRFKYTIRMATEKEKLLKFEIYRKQQINDLYKQMELIQSKIKYWKNKNVS